MPHDIRFEAAYFRAALLIGLAHERDVPEWAESRFGRSVPLDAALAEVLTVNVELTAMREALRSIAYGVDDARVSAALLTTIRRGSVDEGYPAVRTLQHLGQLRRECVNPPEINDAIKSFEDRLMLGDAGVAMAKAPTVAELGTWLSTVSIAGHYLFDFDGTEELAAFVAAVSRKIVRDRTYGEVANTLLPRVWAALQSSSRHRVAVLNESAARIVARDFAPVPVASTVPYPSIGPDVELVIDSPKALALGAADAAAVL